MFRKQRVNFLFIAIYLLIIIIMGSSCATQKNIPDKPAQAEITKVQEEIMVKLRYIPEKQKVLKYGKENNPFVSPVSALRTRLLVFECVIDTSGMPEGKNYRIILNRIELQFGRISTNPLNRFHLYNFWEPRLKNQDEYKKWNRSVLRKIIKENVFPNELEIVPGEIKSGLIVFQGRFPNYGDATIYLPIFDKKNQQLTRFIFNFEF